jgi:hypothetical protein
MNITTKNYFSTVKKFNVKDLPEILFLSHEFIVKETKNGTDWSAFEKDAGFTRMAKLVFKKLEEFMSSDKKVKPNKNLDGVKPKSKQANAYAALKTEVYFIEWFLEFSDTVTDKKKIGIFIDELKAAIEEKKITKKSLVAKDIMSIQHAAIDAYNSNKRVKYFLLKPETIKHLKGIIEKYENSRDDIDENLPKTKKKSAPLEGINRPEEHIMSSVDFADMEFDTIGFKGKWLNLIGDPSPGFTAMVFGMPKMGKSYLCLDFANYLSLNHGKVLYVSNEEYMSPTLAIKLKDKNVANDNLDITGSIPDDLSPYDFIFLDSVTSLKLSPDQLKELKEKNPTASFVYVFQVTKDGKARGANEHTHNVDVVIEVPEKGKAVQYGRFNQGGSMNIFGDDEYAENKEDTQADEGLDVSENKSTLAGIKKTHMKPKEEKKKPAENQNWTEPKHLDASDWKDLKLVKRYYDEGNFKQAMNYASRLESIVREEIPSDIWQKLGGKIITKENYKKFMPTDYSSRADDINPNYLFSLTPTALLVEALRGEFDMVRLVMAELANRGLNKEGNWVGFTEAAKIHKIKE